MSNEKFTPGEWTVHLGIMEPTFVHTGKEDDYVDGETPVICELHHGIKKRHPNTHCMDFDHTEMNANAALISAAPKMYSLLKLARHEFEAVAEWCDEHDLPDDARGYRNLANGILDVLMEIRGKGGEE